MILYLFKLILILIFNIFVNIYYINSGCNCCCCRSKQTDTGSGGGKSNSDILPGGGGLEEGDKGVEEKKGEVPKKNDKKGEKKEEDKDKEKEKDKDKKEDKEEDKDKDKKEELKAEDKKGNIKEEKKEEKKDTNKPIVIEFGDNNKIKINSKNLDLSYKNIPEGIVHPSFKGCTTFWKLDEDIYNSFTTNIEITFKNPPDENTFILFAVKINENEYYLGCCNNGNSVKDNGLFRGSEHNNEIKMLRNGYGLNNIKSMFLGDINLKNIVFTKYFDTSNVTDMSCMFYGCESLTSLDLSNFNTNNVTDMNCMFYLCSRLNKLNLSTFDTSNVTNMNNMFLGCSSLKELNLSNFNTNNVTDMSYMFYECSSLKELNLNNFNTNNVTNMSDMFSGCSDELNLKIKSKYKIFKYVAFKDDYI